MLKGMAEPKDSKIRQLAEKKVNLDHTKYMNIYASRDEL